MPLQVFSNRKMFSRNLLVYWNPKDIVSMCFSSLQQQRSGSEKQRPVRDLKWFGMFKTDPFNILNPSQCRPVEVQFQKPEEDRQQVARWECLCFFRKEWRCKETAFVHVKPFPRFFWAIETWSHHPFLGSDPKRSAHSLSWSKLKRCKAKQFSRHLQESMISEPRVSG